MAVSKLRLMQPHGPRRSPGVKSVESTDPAAANPLQNRHLFAKMTEFCQRSRTDDVGNGPPDHIERTDMRVSELIEKLEAGPVGGQIERLRGFVVASIPQNFEHKWPGYLVHGFTASGAALAFLALVAAVADNAALCFFWLGIALIVDGVDGSIARRIDIESRVPNISGDTLDLVVDFTTYVFVPAALLYYANEWSSGAAMFAGLVITVTAALYFSDKRMKTPDKWFAGFPGVWNVVVFYLILYPPNDWLFVAIILFFAIGQALPIVFVHPFRVKQWKVLTLAVCGVWLVACASAVWQSMKPDLFTDIMLIATGLYLGCLGIFRRPLNGTETTD
jgi:phosphatidylcholine synthase